VTRARSVGDLYLWQIDRGNGTPLFRQIYQQIRSAALSGALRPGTKLPSSRDLASQLGLARASVVTAYDQLLAEGFLSGKVGSGTYISSDLSEQVVMGPPKHRRPPAKKIQQGTAQAQTFDALTELTTPSDVRPFSTVRTRVDARTMETLRKLTNRAFRHFGPSDLGYSDPRGFIELRKTICEYLQVARAVRCDPEQIIVTSGTQHAIDIAIRILLRPGDEVWVEDPGYPMTHSALVAAGMKACPTPVDALGMNVGAGIKSAPKAVAAFVTSSHQYPTGVVLSMARRLELLDWARETGAWIIEDDYASEYRYSGRPLASLQGLDDAERVLYVGTLNKALFPGLRVGYAVVPPSLLRAFVGARYLMDRQPPSLYQTVIAEFMRQGHFAAHIRRTRLMYRDQRDILASELMRRVGTHVTFDVPDNGMHLIAYLGQGVSDVELERTARERGVVVRAMSRFYKLARPRQGLMLGFAGYPSQMIVPAVARLGQVIRESARPPRVKRH